MMLKLRRVALLGALLAAVGCASRTKNLSPDAASAAKVPAMEPEVRVSNGSVLRGGRVYQGIGINYFLLFTRLRDNPADLSSLEGMQKLAEKKIPFIRFLAGPYWPKDLQLYLADKPEYFRRMDLVVRKAESCGMGLIPSLSWNYWTWGDLAGEPCGEIGNPASKSSALMRRYVEDVVGRYANSKAIWGWELGNELNLSSDLPNASSQRPPIYASLGTPATRSEKDEFPVSVMLSMQYQFATTVRKIDPVRMLITGNSNPRATSWHNSYNKSWKSDTQEQTMTALLRDNVSLFDTLGIHYYATKENRWGSWAKSDDELLEKTAALARLDQRPLVIGEIGIQPTIEKEGPAACRAAFGRLLQAIEREHIPLSALWVFDLPGQENEFNVTFTNARAWMLDEVVAANERITRGNSPRFPGAGPVDRAY